MQFGVCVVVGESGESSGYQREQQQQSDLGSEVWAHCLSCRVSPASSDSPLWKDDIPRKQKNIWFLQELLCVIIK